METKKISLVIIVISIILLVVMGSLVYQLKTQTGTLSCPLEQDGKICPYHLLYNLALPIYFMFFIGLLLFLIGLYLFTRKETPKFEIGKEIKKEERDLSKLTSEEKTIFELVQSAGGTIFQSELVEKTQLSKVKITRILDKLEGKGLIERRRRGMTNVVLLRGN